VLKALDQSTTQLREKLGESLASIQRFDKPLEEATTSSLEALKAFALGDAKHNTGNDLASIPFYKQAIELVPTSLWPMPGWAPCMATTDSWVRLRNIVRRRSS
jgi:hypothetical protein